MTAQPRPLFLHIGCRKSGTSYLQAAIEKSQDALERQGLGFPLEGRPDHVSSLLNPLTSFDGEQVPPRVHRALSRLVTKLEQTEGSRLLMTMEDLAELDARRAALVVGRLSDFELHLVITVRDWARQIPSEWQQCVKQRLVTPYPEYAAGVRDGTADGELFRARQDVLGIAARWGADLPPERIHVVAVPPSGSDPRRLLDLFAQVVDVDPVTLGTPGGGNPSLGYEQAETLRRVNLALGDRLRNLRREYRWAVRQLIYKGALIKQTGSPLRLPPELAAWCHEATQAQAQALTVRGYDIVGSVEHLVSSAQPDARDLPVITEAHVADVAVTALADVAVTRWHELKEAEQPAERPVAAGAPPADEQNARGLRRRLRRGRPDR